jgi:hypothetical protein
VGEKSDVETLRQWALMADAIQTLKVNHFQRLRRIKTLLSIVEERDYVCRPLWHETLVDLLKNATEDGKRYRLAYTHEETKGILSLFQDLCLHVADNYDTWWLAWVQAPADEKPKPHKAPPQHNPFLDYFEEEDEDEDTEF